MNHTRLCMECWTLDDCRLARLTSNAGDACRSLVTATSVACAEWHDECASWDNCSSDCRHDGTSPCGDFVRVFMCLDCSLYVDDEYRSTHTAERSCAARGRYTSVFVCLDCGEHVLSAVRYARLVGEDGIVRMET